MKRPAHETEVQTQGRKHVKARKLLKLVPRPNRVHEQQVQVQENSCPRPKRKNRSREDFADTMDEEEHADTLEEDTRSTSRGRNKRNRTIQPTIHSYVFRTGSMLTKITLRKKSSYVPSDNELRCAVEDVTQHNTDANGTRISQNEDQVLRTLRKQNLYWKITPSRIKEILRKVDKEYVIKNNL